MKITQIHTIFISLVLTLAATTARAGTVTIPNTFSANTTARASEVNDNFSAVKTAVDDNDSRITALQSSPSITGNLVLPTSSDANTGVIMKGSNPFLHDYGHYDNTFLGGLSGNFSLTGYGNIGSGYATLHSNTSGVDNAAFGAYSLMSNADGNLNTGIGYAALGQNTSGSYNTALGSTALNGNMTGDNNTASGYSALRYNTTGYNNTATGMNALENNNDGYYNTATGMNTLVNNSSGYRNTASGYQALTANTIGSTNTAIGWESLFNNTSGSYNVALGGYALAANSTGSHNIAIGAVAGDLLNTGSFNIDIGNEGNSYESSTIRIGNAQQTATFIAGISGTTVSGTTVVVDSNGQLGVATSSRKFKDHIKSMGDASKVLDKLRPVTFYYKSDHDPRGRHLQYGLVAEEVAKVAPSLVAHNKDGSVETVYYRFLAPMLVDEYQKQQHTIKEQAAELDQQASLIHRQAKQIAALKAQSAHIAELDATVKQIDVLKRQMARLTTIIAARQQSQQVAFKDQ